MEAAAKKRNHNNQHCIPCSTKMQCDFFFLHMGECKKASLRWLLTSISASSRSCSLRSGDSGGTHHGVHLVTTSRKDMNSRTCVESRGGEQPLPTSAEAHRRASRRLKPLGSDRSSARAAVPQNCRVSNPPASAMSSRAAARNSQVNASEMKRFDHRKAACVVSWQ